MRVPMQILRASHAFAVAVRSCAALSDKSIGHLLHAQRAARVRDLALPKLRKERLRSRSMTGLYSNSEKSYQVELKAEDFEVALESSIKRSPCCCRASVASAAKAATIH